jgi:hypothetical protein
MIARKMAQITLVFKLALWACGLLASLAAAGPKPAVTAWYNGCAELWGASGQISWQTSSLNTPAILPAYLPEFGTAFLG